MDAEPLLREAFATAESLFGPGNPVTLGAQRSLATVLEGQRRHDEARALREAGLSAALAAFGENDVYVAIALSGLGQNSLMSGRVREADGYFRRALAVRLQLHNANDWHVDDARARLGWAVARAGKLEEAEALLTSGYAGLRKHRGDRAEETREAKRWLEELRRLQARALGHASPHLTFK